MAGRYKQVYSKQKRSDFHSTRMKAKMWNDQESARLRSESTSEDEDDETCGIFCFGLGLILMFVGVAILATVIVYNQSDQNHGPVTTLTSTREVKPVSKQLTKALETPNSLIHVKTVCDIQRPVVAEKLSLLVIVRSLPEFQNLRASIRETWMPHSGAGLDVFVVFSIPAKDVSSKRLESLKEESRTNKDMVVFLESNSIPESELLLFEWVWAVNTFNFHYLLKVRDSMYVKLPLLISEIVKNLIERNSNAYLGYFEGNRNPKNSGGKLDEPNWFLCDRFIRYAHSGGYILSEVLVKRLLRQAKFLHPYNNEDVALGTWLSPFNDIDWIHETRFDTETGKARGCKNNNFISQTENNVDMIIRHHNFVQTGRYCAREYENIQTYSYNFDTLPSQCCEPL